MNSVLSGTVMFLFTGIEDSTRLWQQEPEAIESDHGIFQIFGASCGGNHHPCYSGIDGPQAVLHGRQFNW